MTSRAAGTESLPRALWEFVPRPRVGAGRDDELRFRDQLVSALRAGHGLGVRFRVEIEAGPTERVAVSVEEVRSASWAERALFPAYPAGSWRRSAPGKRRPATVLRVGRHRGRTLGAFGPAAEVGRLARALQAALRASNSEVSLAVALRPTTRSSLADLEDLWPSARSAGPRQDYAGRRPTGRPVTAAAHEIGQHDPAPTWSGAIVLRGGTLSSAVGDARVASAVRSAWTRLEGGKLDLRPPGRWSLGESGSVFAETDVLALLPAHDDPVAPLRATCSGAPGIPLGRTGTGEPVALAVEPGQGRHFAVIGETGMGKSSLLVSVTRRAAAHSGVLLLDPLGETAASVARELREEGRDVLEIAPETPGAELNALASISASLRADPVRAERALEGLVHALRRVRSGRYADSPYWGPRLEEMLVRALRAAAAVPTGTLEDAHALLARAGAGRAVVPEGARAELRELEARVRDRPDDAEGARRLLYEIVRNPTLLRMLCAREPKLAIGELVAPRRAVVISGDAARVGESTARYLVAAYLALVWSELLSRESAPKTFVLLDEAQWFAHEGLAEMLRLARRRNVHVGVATQSLAALPEEVQEAVRTNAADLVVFRGSAEAAQALARANPSVPAAGLIGLGRGEAVVLLGKGETVRWIRTARLPDRERGAPWTIDSDALGSRRPARRTEADAGGPEGELPPGLATELRGRLAATAPASLVAVDLAGLRRRGVAAERDLRVLGSALGRRAAIARNERRGDGPLWWVDRKKLGELLDELAPLPPPRDSQSPQQL